MQGYKLKITITLYVVKKIENWRAKVETELQILVDKNLAELAEIIKSEINPTDKLTINMGLASIEDKKGQSYVWDYGTLDGPPTPDGVLEFIDELTRTTRRDYFETSIEIVL